MSDEPARPETAEPDPESPAERRRRLAAVFGDALPETTSDERDPDPGESAAAESAADAWLREQVPPHHG